MNRFAVFMCFFLTVTCVFSQNRLEKKIDSIIQGKKAIVGVAVIFEGKDTLVVNNQYYYPTLSVFKFHLALTVLNYLDKNKLSLDTKIFVNKSDLLPDTYSPLRDTRPEGNFYMSVEDLLRYTVSMSDNNACDILFKYVEGTQAVQKYIESLEITGVRITATEKEMHDKFENQYLNLTTPLAATQLLEVFLKKPIFSDVYKEFLEKTMIETSTGSDKLKALLPSEVIVGHKTGSSFRDESGLKVADNDIGFICLPDGKQYSIAVFVKDSREDDKTNASLIAEISKAVYEYYKTR